MCGLSGGSDPVLRWERSKPLNRRGNNLYWRRGLSGFVSPHLSPRVRRFCIKWDYLVVQQSRVFTWRLPDLAAGSPFFWFLRWSGYLVQIPLVPSKGGSRWCQRHPLFRRIFWYLQGEMTLIVTYTHLLRVLVGNGSGWMIEWEVKE